MMQNDVPILMNTQRGHEEAHVLLKARAPRELGVNREACMDK